MSALTGQVRAIGGMGNPSRKPYLVQVIVDLAVAATESGGTLVATDTIQCITVPDETVILAAGCEVFVTPTGGNSFTMDLGVTGGVVDNFVDGFAVTSSTKGDYAPFDVAMSPVMIQSEDTLDILCIGTTMDTVGKLRVWARLQDVSDLGDRAADEVDRDQLA